MSLLHRSILVFSLLLGLTTTYFAHSFIENKADLVSKNRFIEASKSRVNAIRLLISDDFNVLEAIKAFYNASIYVSKDEFELFAVSLLKNNTSIQSLSWVETKPHDEKSGSNSVHSDSNSAYNYSVVYDVSLQDNKKEPNDALMLNDNHIQHIMKHAEKKGDIFTLPLGRQGKFKGTLAALPVYSNTMGSGDTLKAQGFVIMRVYFSSLIGQALHSIPSAGIHITIKDNDDILGHHVPRQQNLNTSQAQSNNKTLIYQELLHFSGTYLNIIAEGISDVFYPANTLRSYATIIVGVIISLLVTFIIYVYYFLRII